MRAFVFTKYSKDPQSMEWQELTDPKPNANQLIVRIKAVAINPVDWKQRNGELKAAGKLEFPFVPGKDFSGIVEQTTEGDSKFKVGEEVYGVVPGFQTGAYAEKVAVDSEWIALKPSQLNFAEAASFPVSFLTSYRILAHHWKVSKGDRVLIHAGAGGVGTIAIQIAKALGCHVATTASKGKHEFVKALGADEVVDYQNEKISDILKDYDLVLDSIGDEKTRLESIKVLRNGGKLISINGTPTAAFMKTSGANFLIQFVMKMLNRKVYSACKKKQVAFEFFVNDGQGADLKALNQWVQSGTIKPVIDEVFDFEDGHAAFAKQESHRAKGKIVVEIKA